jgi:hypothetical protein
MPAASSRSSPAYVVSLESKTRCCGALPCWRSPALPCSPASFSLLLPEEAILTHEQILAQLEERGLPTDLVGVLREAPAELDPGEDPDPFGMMKMIEGEAEETSGT